MLKETRVRKMRSFDLNQLIAATYGIKSFECTLEADRDSVHSFKIKKEELDIDEMAELKEFIRQGDCEIYRVDLFLTDLCYREKLQPGEYLIDID